MMKKELWQSISIMMIRYIWPDSDTFDMYHELTEDEMMQFFYINSPLSVTDLVNTDNQKAVALLHYVVEDSNVRLADLRELGVPNEIVNWFSNEKSYMAYELFLSVINNKPNLFF